MDTTRAEPGPLASLLSEIAMMSAVLVVALGLAPTESERHGAGTYGATSLQAPASTCGEKKAPFQTYEGKSLKEWSRTLLESDNPFESLRTVDVLGKFGEEGIAELIKALKGSKVTAVRTVVAHALNPRESKAAAEAL